MDQLEFKTLAQPAWVAVQMHTRPTEYPASDLVNCLAPYTSIDTPLSTLRDFRVDAPRMESMLEGLFKSNNHHPGTIVIGSKFAIFLSCSADGTLCNDALRD